MSSKETLGSASDLETVAREWTRLGVTGFGGPPAHIALLRSLVVDRYAWMSAEEFEDANAACGLLPGPASTQLAILCAYRAGGWRAAVVGGCGFIIPSVVMILALSVLFLSSAPPPWVSGAGAGAGAAVAAVAVHAARGLLGPSFQRARQNRTREIAWCVYLIAGATAAALIGPSLVLVLLGCGLLELIRQRRFGSKMGVDATPMALLLLSAVSLGGVGALAWTAFKVGALSYGGGFVIIPLMQEDAVNVYGWMSDAQFLNAVALGQVTPGPVVSTVAAVGYAAYGIPGGLLAATVAFLPSFSFILIAGGRFERLRNNLSARAFLDGAGPAAIGAIFGASVTLAAALSETWQFLLLGAAAVALLLIRRGVVETLLVAGLAGVVIALAGGPLP